ncbi:ABC transporter substrate-binding protein [Aliihoeflea sp. 40Bstr573]|uniref:ABC transporter substrate-binding protein n=1 Tax=Aliihoeflea sp. 40Bstr573 TaxID=2696467 RepID=UPI00209413F6|nr:ABC transporter substrate-binding protein [Aliihoeflea sp. 40Bstr573]MCO6388752.1 ABC transporter substrate-binding protein [Aliihoeflea sp. 40Bstr573]
MKMRYLASSILMAGFVSAAQAQETKPIIIGAAIAQTGFIAAYDADPAKAAEMAVNEINEGGGVLGRPLKLIYADTKSEIPQGAVAAMEVLDQGADIVIVTGDFDFGGTAARTANSQGKVAIAPFAADPKFGVEGIGPYAFSFSTASDTVGTVLAEFATAKGWKTAYALTQTTIQYDLSVSAAFQARFKEQNGDAALVGVDTFTMDDASIATHITRIKALDPQPDVLLLSTLTPAGPGALRQLRTAGLTMPILSGEDMDGDYWLESVPDLSNFYFAAMGSIFGDDPRPDVKKFIDDFTALHGNHPSTAHTLTGYSVIQGIKVAAERAGSIESDAIKAEFEKFKDEPLLVGPTSFDENTHINFERPMVIMQVQDGKHSAVELRAPEKIPGR